MTRHWVTVFGGTGFLGRRIVRQLLEADMGVRIAARRPFIPSGIEEDPDKIKLSPVDVHDPQATEQAIRGSEAVVNAVSLYVEKGGRATFKKVHVDAAERIARLSADHKIARLVHISGLGVDQNSDSAYVRARAMGDVRVRETFPNATVLRPSVLFGPDDAFLKSVALATLAPIVPLFGNGDTRLQPVYVDDVAKAVQQVLIQPDTAGRIYELGGPDVLTYRNIVRQVMAHQHRRRPLLSWPFFLWRAQAQILRILPNPPLTRDQVILMEKDNRVGEDAQGFEDLGLEPRSLSALLEVCLGR